MSTYSVLNLGGLSHSTHDLSQAEQMHKMAIYFTQKGWSCYFVSCSACNNSYIFCSLLEISHVLNGTTPEIQHWNWGPQRNLGVVHKLKLRPIWFPSSVLANHRMIGQHKFCPSANISINDSTVWQCWLLTVWPWEFWIKVRKLCQRPPQH